MIFPQVGLTWTIPAMVARRPQIRGTANNDRA